jgi:hypothetical protein
MSPSTAEGFTPGPFRRWHGIVSHGLGCQLQLPIQESQAVTKLKALQVMPLLRKSDICSHLEAHLGLLMVVAIRKNGRGERIRTSDPLVPNQVLYQAEPLPERLAGYSRVESVPGRCFLLSRET